MSNPNGEQFEAAICESLTSGGGYVAVKNDKAQGEPRDFDPVRGLDTADQALRWRPRHRSGQVRRSAGLRAGQAGSGRRLAPRRGRPRRHAANGLLPPRPRADAGAGRPLRGQPAHGYPSAPLRGDYGQGIDLALFVNGIPVATAELKNPLTGQGVEQAIGQYRRDRDPKNRTLARAVVHFAVDPSGWP